MTRFEIIGLKEPRGVGSGWETAEQAQGFIQYLCTSPMIGQFVSEGVKIADLKIKSFDFQFDEPKIEVRKVIADDSKYVEGIGLFDAGKTKTAYELYEDGVIVTTFYKEPSEKDIQIALRRE